jgi:hypothetical protein
MNQKQEIFGGSGYFRQSSAGLFYKVCGKCGGDGIYWLKRQSANGWGVVPDVCFPCNGNGATGKGYSREEVEKKAVAYEKRKAAEQAKWEAEWEAGREQREAEEVRRAEAIAKRESERAQFVYFPAEVGDKVEVAGEVVMLREIESQFGVSMLVVVKVAEDCEVKMFSSASWVYEIEEGQRVVLKAEIKAHEEYDGKKQSQLVRPKRVG